MRNDLCRFISQGKDSMGYNLNLVRFAHNWNDGMLEYWNIGSVMHLIEKYHDT
jgi:hypothetical protein